MGGLTVGTSGLRMDNGFAEVLVVVDGIRELLAEMEQARVGGIEAD